MLKKLNNLKPKYYRLIWILLTLICISIGLTLILYNLNQNIVFFYPPSKLSEAKAGANIRIGGIVKNDSVVKIPTNQYNFIITDNIAEIQVSYTGILPIMFREGQGVVVEGQLNDPKNFIAKRILIKHDENYKPPISK